MPIFVYQHKSGRKYIHPKGGSANPSNDTNLVLHGDVHENIHWIFEPVDGPWGYIKHETGGKIWHPYGGELNPGNDTYLVLHGDRHAGALFAFDEVNNWIVHKGGKFVHPKGGNPNPSNETYLVLHEDKHDAMRFVYLNQFNLNEEISMYGKPRVNGAWKIISSVLNPLAEHTYTMEYTLGKSKTESTEYEFTFKWETTASAQVMFVEASTTASLTAMVKKSSSTTWSEEQKVTRKITIEKGTSVVTWQYVFTGEQLGSKATFLSNILADTRSPNIEPDETLAIQM